MQRSALPAVLFTTLFTLFAGVAFLYAVEVSVTATVSGPPPPEQPPTQVRFTGLAYPGTNVTIAEKDTTIATVPADPNAAFDVTVTIDPGEHTFDISGTDAAGVTGEVFNVTLTLASGTTVTITGIFLSPTITQDTTEVTVGDTITLFGMTVPESTVSIFVSSEEETTYTTNADEDGEWSRSFIAGDGVLAVGSHEARAKATAPDDSVSEFSKTVAFSVVAAEEQPPDPCDGKTAGDLNCDSAVNLVDFSILLFYWQQSSPANVRADINTDGIVDIIDFSILLFYWTG